MTKEEAERIRQELRDAGATTFGLAKFASRHLPTILHEGEHVEGIVYGRYEQDNSLFKWAAGMLIATDRRVIFLDRKPGFEMLAELTYDAVSGVQRSYAWPFAAVTLHTRIGNYTLRYANKRCINIFMNYVEKRRLESAYGTFGKVGIPIAERPLIDDKTLAFLNSHHMAVLSTVDRSGTIHGAAIHCLIGEDRSIYVLAKTKIQKARNIFASQQAALTLYDQAAMQTVQIRGSTIIESDQVIVNKMFALLNAPPEYGSVAPASSDRGLTANPYTVLRFELRSIRFFDFTQENIPMD